MPFYSGPFGHDRVWERDVVQRIRDGRGAPQIDFDYHPYPHSWGAPPIITGEPHWAKEADLSEDERREKLRKDLKEALDKAAENRKKAEEKRKQAAAEKEARQRERERFEALDRAAWQREEQRRQHLTEVHRVLQSKWSCIACGGHATIKLEGEGYRLTCHGLLCGKTAWGKHESLMKVLNR